ncbi:hypothetical protein DRJ54_00055 [Candidatus Acetothermia bacterium]|nr:MAG: hypothetical protein DRJ54_00055 [Candidatus Acetothermia bacterium]
MELEGLRRLVPPGEAEVLWVEIADKDLHFLDGVLMVTDGLANVRREFREEGGRKLFKLYIAPGQLEEVRRLIVRAGRFVHIGEVVSGG